MEDFEEGDDQDGLFRRLRADRERRKSLETTYEDVADANEGLDGEWGEWMCPSCGIFMKERHRSCLRCRSPRC